MTPEAPVSLAAIWLLGVALGLTACTVTCLPFMATWALGRSDDGRVAVPDTLSFLAGRFFAYTGLGGLAGALGAWFVQALAGGVGHLAIGLSSLLAALWLAWPRRAGASAGCASLRSSGLASPFLMGVSLTLIPCAPLSTLLASCAASASWLSGMRYGAAFASGAVLTPMLVLIPAAAGLGKVLRSNASWLGPWLRYGAALVLLLLGGKRISLFDEHWALAACLLTALLLALAHLAPRADKRRHQIIPIKSLG